METIDNAAQTTMSMLHDLFVSYHPRDFAVRLWDGTTWGPEVGQSARFTLVLQHPGSLRKMFLPPTDLTLGEAYIYNDFDIEGDIESIAAVGYHFIRGHWSEIERLRFGQRLLSLPDSDRVVLDSHASKIQGALHSLQTDRQAAMFHYDRSNDFYKLWLDRRMVYTCAYFSTPDDSIDTAQERKLAYICCKLRLRPGERILDIGCGWGGFLIYAAQHYDVEAVGITLSQQQADLARERIKEAGLEARCRVDICDYREVHDYGSYDKIVSIGMFEQIGEELLPTYFKQAWQLLRPGGIFLNHGMSLHSLAPKPREPSFVHRYAFPSADLSPLPTTLQAAEINGFEIRDVESLREHYVYTLRNWVRRLEEQGDEIKRLTDEVTYRIWRLYISVSIYHFKVGNYNLHQTLLVKPIEGKSGLPLTREDWYV